MCCCFKSAAACFVLLAAALLGDKKFRSAAKARPSGRRPGLAALAEARAKPDTAVSALLKRFQIAICRPGGDLLSHTLRCSTIGAGEFHGRVRDGIGWGLPARATRPAKRNLRELVYIFI